MDDLEHSEEPERDPEREREKAIKLAYGSAGHRERTEAELRTFLERRRLGPEAIDDAVAELTAAGLLDDARYAQRFAEDRRSLDHWGSERIARDLQRRGIALELIEAAVADRTREAELDSAVGLLARRMPPPADAATSADQTGSGTRPERRGLSVASGQGTLGARRRAARLPLIRRGDNLRGEAVLRAAVRTKHQQTSLFIRCGKPTDPNYLEGVLGRAHRAARARHSWARAPLLEELVSRGAGRTARN
jgi:regulatory protein